MILELKVLTDGTMSRIERNETYITIYYNRSADIHYFIPQIETAEWDKISTLIIWGGHGLNNSICRISHFEILGLLGHIPSAVNFNTIVLDACESACLANLFLNKLADNGVILCHIGIAAAQVLQDNKPTDENIRMMWWKINSATVSMEISGYPMSVFPSICRKNANLSYYFEDGEFEMSDNNPLGADDLQENLGILKANGINAIREEQAIFIADNFYESHLQ